MIFSQKDIMLVFSLVTDLRASLPSNNFSRSFANNDIDYTIPSGPRYELHTRSQLARRGLTRLDNGGTRRRERGEENVLKLGAHEFSVWEWVQISVGVIKSGL